MINKFFIPKYWYISWAILSGIFLPFEFIINILTHNKLIYLFLVSEFLAPMIFGIYLCNKEKFKINLLKILTLFAILIFSVIFLGKLSMAIAPVIILIFMWIIKISRYEAKWAFGTIILYIFSAIPGFIILLYFDMGLFGFILLNISKGAIFGKIMQIIYTKKQNFQ